MSHPNDELIERFYGAFAERRGEAMAACYASDAHFSDPVFPDLNGAEPGQMWRMLTGAADDLQIELVEHEAGDETGSARWRAHYTFAETGRPVVNDIGATFRFADGLIADHRDEFDFHKWSRQALGLPGLLLGWTPIIRGEVRKKAGARLAEFIARDGDAPDGGDSLSG